MLILTERCTLTERAQVLLQRLSQHPYLMHTRARWDLEEDTIVLEDSHSQGFFFSISSDSNLGCWFVTYSPKKQRIMVHPCNEYSPLASAYYFLGSCDDDEHIISFVFDECRRVRVFPLPADLPLEWMNQNVLRWFADLQRDRQDRSRTMRDLERTFRLRRSPLHSS